jgi:hypothetical protein
VPGPVRLLVVHHAWRLVRSRNRRKEFRTRKPVHTPHALPIASKCRKPAVVFTLKPRRLRGGSALLLPPRFIKRGKLYDPRLTSCAPDLSFLAPPNLFCSKLLQLQLVSRVDLARSRTRGEARATGYVLCSPPLLIFFQLEPCMQTFSRICNATLQVAGPPRLLLFQNPNSKFCQLTLAILRESIVSLTRLLVRLSTLCTGNRLRSYPPPTRSL